VFCNVKKEKKPKNIYKREYDRVVYSDVVM